MDAQHDDSLPEECRTAIAQRFGTNLDQLDGWLAQKQTDFRNACWTIRGEWFLSCKKILRPCLENCWRMSRGLPRGVMAPVSEKSECPRLTSGMDQCESKCLSVELADAISKKVQSGELATGREEEGFWRDLQHDAQLRQILCKHGICTTHRETSQTFLSLSKLEELLRGIYLGVKNTDVSPCFSPRLKTVSCQVGENEAVPIPPCLKYSDYYPTDPLSRSSRRFLDPAKQLSPVPPTMSLVAMWPERRLRKNQVSQGTQSCFPKYGLYFIKNGTCFASDQSLRSSASQRNSSAPKKIDKSTQVNFPHSGTHIFKSKSFPMNGKKVSYISHVIATPPHSERRWRPTVKTSKSMPYHVANVKKEPQSTQLISKTCLTRTWKHQPHTPFWPMCET